MGRFEKVAQTSDLAPGQGKEVQVDGCVIALFNVDGAYYALEGICNHAGAPLCDGLIDGDLISCPWHFAQFNVKTGAMVTPPATGDLRVFPVKVEGSSILVEVD